MPLLLTLYCKGQWIQQLKTNPSNPTTITPVEFIAEIDFPSGGCSDKTLTILQNGNVFSGNAMHCLGVAAFICNDKDTFQLGLLPAGNYTFYYQVDMGLGVTPCTPGIVPGPIDSLHFTVNAATGISEPGVADIGLYPNPAFDKLHLKWLNHPLGANVKVLNAQGACVLSTVINGNEMELDISRWATGLYTVVFGDGGKNTWIKKFSKK